MKLITKSGGYVHPNPQKGIYPNAYIRDGEKRLGDQPNEFYVNFLLCYEVEGVEVIVEKINMQFIGKEEDINSETIITTNQPSYVDYPNPDFEISNPDSDRFIRENLIDHITRNNGVIADDVVLVEYGYPTYERATMFFTGGSVSSPELVATNDIAKAFCLNKIKIYNEPIGVQFKFED